MQFFEGEPKSQPEITTPPTPNELKTLSKWIIALQAKTNMWLLLFLRALIQQAKTSPTKDDHTLVNIPTARQGHGSPSQSNHSSQRASFTILDTLFPVIALDRSRLMEPDTLLHPIEATMESTSFLLYKSGMISMLFINQCQVRLCLSVLLLQAMSNHLPSP